MTCQQIFLFLFLFLIVGGWVVLGTCDVQDRCFQSSRVSQSALIYNNYNTATIGTMSQFITYYSDTGTNTRSYTALLSRNPLTNIIKEGWFGYIYLLSTNISRNANDTRVSPLTLSVKMDDKNFTREGGGSNCVTANLMLIVVNVCYEWKIIHWSQSPGINLLGFVQCVFIQLLSRGIYYGPFGYCSMAHNGKLEIYCEPKQREGRGRTSYRLAAKVGTGGREVWGVRCELNCEHFKTC